MGTKIMGYIATNTGSKKSLPIAPTLLDAIEYLMTETEGMLKANDLNAFKAWEIDVAEATLETEDDTPFDVTAMMATAAGAWEEVKPAFVFLLSAADTLKFRPFASDCAK